MAQTKPKAGQFYGVSLNGTDGQFLRTDGTGGMSWASPIISPVITSISYPGSATGADPAGGETITVTGVDLPLQSSVIQVGGTVAPVISYNTSTELSFTTPAKATGDYDLKLTSSNGTSDTLVNGISYSGVPTWTTASGSLGSFLRTNAQTVSVTVLATETGGASISYSLTTGVLPPGFALNTSTGVISGTVSDPGSVTTYSFTITATDTQQQITPRAFSITFRDLQTFTYTTSTTFVVPVGITSITVQLAAGGAGGGGGGSGGGCGYATGGNGAGGGIGAGSSYAASSGSQGGNYTGGAGGNGGGAVYSSPTTITTTPGASIAFVAGDGGAGGLGGYFKGGSQGGSFGGRAGSSGSNGTQSSFGSLSTSGTNSTINQSGNAGNGGSATFTAVINDQDPSWYNYNGRTGGVGASGVVKLTY